MKQNVIQDLKGLKRTRIMFSYAVRSKTPIQRKKQSKWSRNKSCLPKSGNGVSWGRILLCNLLIQRCFQFIWHTPKFAANNDFKGYHSLCISLERLSLINWLFGNCPQVTRIAYGGITDISLVEGPMEAKDPRSRGLVPWEVGEDKRREVGGGALAQLITWCLVTVRSPVDSVGELCF